VFERSRCLILGPLLGHSPNARKLGEAGLRETVKELAQLDGGLVISGTGTVVSACRYFESMLPHHDQPLGLGTRHLAAVSISASTATVAVVVSERCVVRIFNGGALHTEILPELWLLHRYMPHIAEATLTSDTKHNVAIVSDGSAENG
jgi:diadenylate cyclase